MDKRPVRTGHYMSNVLWPKPKASQPTAQLACRLIEQAARYSPEGIISFDSRGDCVWMNQAAAQMLRLNDATWLVGRLNLRHHSKVDGQRDRSKIDRAFQGAAVELPEFS